ncbi:MAG TPA: glycosyltransferase family 4 protein [Candidatus Limnocylindrales bacterium]|nr:glycosyltransferase family 4 protein [Candidatus Limnocylindrales bacterium]
MTTVSAGLLAFVVALVGVRVVEIVSRARNVLDQPVSRSSHTVATPTLGGIGIVLGTWAAAATGNLTDTQLSILVAGTAVAVVGAIDDLRSLAPAVRLALQLAISLAFAVRLEPALTLALPWGPATVSGPAAIALTTTVLVGIVNVWNFMDGLDGLAGGTTVVVALGLLAAGAPAIGLIGVAGATLGFLVWNHHPASIFMGDAGSTFLGFVLAASALSAGDAAGPATFGFVALPFVLDAGVTLVRRGVARKPLLTAHREHHYQRLADAGVDHRSVAALYVGASALSAVAAESYIAGDVVARFAVILAVAIAWVAYMASVRWAERRPRSADRVLRSRVEGA